jgi:hypothetical protein
LTVVSSYLFSGVTSHVFPEIPLLDEGVLADVADRLPLGVAGVHLDVVVPGRPVPEAAATLSAAEIH